VVDDRTNNRLYVRPTKRVVDLDDQRWHPGVGNGNWGLICRTDADQPNLQPLANGGMGPLPTPVPAEGRVGYIHGMCSAIQKCLEWGGDCVPFEVATGTATTKMASCFACSTYMHANGYPPSSMHLGRGESWVPPANHYSNGDHSDMPQYDDGMVQLGRQRWNERIHDFITLGSSILIKAVERGARMSSARVISLPSSA
jgi:hypothetical protein